MPEKFDLYPPFGETENWNQEGEFQIKLRLRAGISEPIQPNRHENPLGLYKGEHFKLNLETTHLLGTEDNKLESIIQSILKGIHYGDKIPPVPVYYHSIKEAFVLADHFDGGHHRAIAHLIANAPLPCKFEATVSFALEQTRDIKDITILAEEEGKGIVDSYRRAGRTEYR